MKIFYTTVLSILFFTINITAQSVYFWENQGGAGDNLWSNPNNWNRDGGGSDGTLPNQTGGDIAYFLGALSTDNCIIDINTTNGGNKLLNFTVEADYTGVITLNTGLTLETTGNFDISNGTFTASGNSIVIIGGDFTWASANTFTAATGGVSVGGNFSLPSGTYTGGTSGTGLSVTGNMAISGGIFTQGSTTLTVTGTFGISSGTFTNGTGDSNFNSTATVNGGTFNKSATGNITFSGALNLSLGSFNVTNTTGAINFDHSFNHTGGTYGCAVNNSNIRLRCSVTNPTVSFTSSGGTFSQTNGTWLFTTNSAAVPAVGTININNTPTFSSVNFSNIIGTCALTVNVASTIAVTGILTITNFVGSAARSITINTGVINFSGPTLAITGEASTLGQGSATIVASGVTTINCPTTEGGTPLCNFTLTGATRTVTVQSGRFLTVGTSANPRTFSVVGGGNITLSAGTVAAYGNVTYSNTGTTGGGNATIKFAGTAAQTLTGNATAGQGKLPNVLINKTGGSLNLVNVISVAGTTWTHTAGTVTPGTSTVVFNNTTSSITGAATPAFHNLTISAGTLTGHNTSMDVSGAFTNNSTYTHANGTVSFNGATASVAGSSTTTFNNLSIASGALTGHATNMIIANNWTNNGTYTHNSGKVTFNSASAQTIGGSSSTTFYDLEINGNGNKTCEANINLTNVLSIAGGSSTFDADGAANNRTFTLLSTSARTAQIGNIGSVTFSGQVTMQRNISGRTDWRMITAPITGQTLAQWRDDFAMAGFPGAHSATNATVFTYDESVAGVIGNGYIAPTHTSDPTSWNDAAVDGKGFFAYIGNTAHGVNMSPEITIDMTGNILTGNGKTVSLTCSDGCDGPEDGWHMIGNPYPAIIDWDNLGKSSANIVDGYDTYVKDGSGNYGHWDGMLQSGTNGATGNIAVGQAFWVNTIADGETLTFDEADKTVSATPDAFLKTAPVNALTANPFEVVKLSISTPINSYYKDETMIAFGGNSVDSFARGEDHIKLYTLNPVIPTISSYTSNGKDVVSNKYPTLTQNLSIGLRTKVGVNGTYSIAANGLAALQHMCISLYDNKTGNTANLKQGPYTYTANTTDNLDRFVLHFSLAPTFVINTTEVAPSCSAQQDGFIVAQPANSGPWNYTWKDLATGNTIKTTSNSSTFDTLTNVGTGTYIVEISSAGACEYSTQTFTVTAPAAAQVALSVNDVNAPTCHDQHDGFIAAQPSGAGLWNYYWKDASTGGTIQTHLGISTPDTLFNLHEGTYIVLAKNANGCDSAIHTFNITAPLQTSAVFTSSNDSVYLSQGATVNFTNTSVNATNYAWNFGDMSTSTLANPSHTYSATGTYSVTLIAYNTACSDTSITSYIIHVLASPSGLSNNNADNNIFIGQDQTGTFVRFGSYTGSNALISVTNLLGQKVMTDTHTKINGQTVYLNLSGINSNILFITVTSDNEQVTKKINN